MQFRARTAIIWTAVAERSGDTAFRRRRWLPKAAWRFASRRSPKFAVAGASRVGFIRVYPGSKLFVSSRRCSGKGWFEYAKNGIEFLPGLAHPIAITVSQLTNPLHEQRQIRNFGWWRPGAGLERRDRRSHH
jgi:hypothetical protein